MSRISQADHELWRYIYVSFPQCDRPEPQVPLCRHHARSDAPVNRVARFVSEAPARVLRLRTAMLARRCVLTSKMRSSILPTWVLMPCSARVADVENQDVHEKRWKE